MGNDSIPNCLNHKDSRNIQVRLDYMLLYRNEAKAKIIRTMETWTDQKRAEWFKLQAESKEQGSERAIEPPEEALWVTMSYEEFSIYAYGTIKRDDIKVKVDDLVHCEYLDRRPHPLPGYAPQYLLNTKFLQIALDGQDLPSLFEDIGKIAPPRKKHTPPEKYPQGEGINTPRVGGKIPPGTGDFSYPSKNTTKNLLESSKNKGEGATSAEGRNAPISLELKREEKRETNPRHPAITLTVSDSQQAMRKEEEEDLAPTEKMKAIPKTSTDGPGVIPARHSGLHPTGNSPASESGAVQGGKPPMALSARAIKAQNEKRKEELWKIVEEERKTTYSKTQRELYENDTGMNYLIEDDISDEVIRAGLQALSPYERRTFTVQKFYGWLPNLSAKEPTPIAGKAPAQANYVNHDLNMQKLEARKARFAANG